MRQAEMERCLKHAAAAAGSAAEHLTLAEAHQPRQLQAPQLPDQPLLLVEPLLPQQMQQRQPCPGLGGLLQARLSASQLRALKMGLLGAVQCPAKPLRRHLAPC